VENDPHGQAFQRLLDALSRASRIYVATVRRDGNQSKAVPVWFALTTGSLRPRPDQAKFVDREACAQRQPRNRLDP